MAYLIAWLIISALLLGYTLVRTQPYRWTRYLTFESIFCLIFLNGQVWFTSPGSPSQILSWCLLAGSAILAAHGFFLIKSRGAPEGDFEETTLLITSGAYRYIRHPLYTSLILLALGAFFKDPSVLGSFLVAATGLGALLTARIEEKHNLERFGEAYREYMGKTRRFIPFIY